MNVTITTWAGGAGFAFAAYALALVVSVLVAGIIALTSYFIRRGTQEPKPAPEKK